ncbi:hypothetical protein [Kitasatospora purpeofusca]|uniref:hypothetical protein n=1 Tax=Kitasatospora purpeofusca TaxID=67352 RepID=UPI0036D2CF4C
MPTEDTEGPEATEQPADLVPTKAERRLDRRIAVTMLFLETAVLVTELLRALGAS